MCVVQIAEARIRLVAGLKRYFHGKRAEGLLSARGVQLLDYACDLQMDDANKPLFMFALIERCDPGDDAGTPSCIVCKSIRKRLQCTQRCFHGSHHLQ